LLDILIWPKKNHFTDRLNQDLLRFIDNFEFGSGSVFRGPPCTSYWSNSTDNLNVRGRLR